MTTATEFQAAIDDGYLYVPAGVHEVDQSLVVTGKGPLLVESHPRGEICWTGQEGGCVFLYERTSEQYGESQATFRGVKINCKRKKGVSGFRARRQAVHHINFDSVNVKWAIGAYAFDFDEMNYSITPVFRDIKTNGSGALRFRAKPFGSDMNHATSQMIVENWRHQGEQRIGPAFDFNGCGGLRLRQIIDEQRAELHKDVKGVYRGAIGLRINNPIQPCYVDDYWFETWGNLERDAPGCWTHEFRTTNSTGHNKQNYIQTTNLKPGNGSFDGPSIVVMGTNTDDYPGNRHSIWVDFVDMHNPMVDDYLIGGLASIRQIRPIFFGSSASSSRKAWLEFEKVLCHGTRNVDGTHVEVIDTSQLLVDPFCIDSARPPRMSRTSPYRQPFYIKSTLYDNWIPTTEDVL